MGFKRLKVLLFHVLFGQGVAFLNSLTGVSTTMLVNDNASYPLLQSVTAYSFIFVVYGSLLVFLYLRNRRQQYNNFTFFYRPWKYAILGLIDMEANFVVVMAYQYTDIISAQLLGCFSIPCVLILSFFLLKMRFALTHVLGCVVATGGLVLLVILDADGVSRDVVRPNVVKGDLLCLLSAALYATSNVLTEKFIKPRFIGGRIGDTEPVGVSGVRVEGVGGVGAAAFESREIQVSRGAFCGSCSPVDNRTSEIEKNTQMGNEEEREQRQEHQQTREEEVEILPDVPKYIPLVENLCCMSGWALVFATIQFFAVEWKTFSPNRGSWTNQNWLYQMLFGLTMLFVYTGLPALFLITSAAFANVSLLAVSVYSIIWNVTIFSIFPTPLFFVSYVIIICGILLYDLSDVHWRWCPRINYPCGDPRETGDM
ncbi:Solute carrier family 35 member SLC35F1/F2/F6 [Trypanosoma melophagium]|uniref:Solute carrier family 35 member SLC35F1/F2/F6 n=1 Tax=Trypanosoma melophagium TaxID=715481 RepID=UPI00351A98A4|nr:Solute carrier family 35 member SLC35F1/F2/F6 [Trypanosoma melophagium]